MRKYNDRVDDEIWKADKLFNRCFHCHLEVIESKKSHLTKKCFSKLKNDAHTSFYTNFKKRAENGPFGPGRAGPICSRAGPPFFRPVSCPVDESIRHKKMQYKRFNTKLNEQ